MSRPRDPYDWESWAWDTIELAGEGLSARAALVLVQLSKHGNAAGVARPSARTLGTLTGCTDKTATKALRELVEAGLVVAVGTHQRATVWRFEHPETADPGSAVEASTTADPGSALSGGSTAERVRTECGESADTGSDEGEVEELQRQHPLSPPSEVQDVRGEAVGSEVNDDDDPYSVRARPVLAEVNGHGHVGPAVVAQELADTLKGMS